MPLGMAILSYVLEVCAPVPLQDVQNYLIFLPSPPQLSQTVCMTIMPCFIVLYPVPPHPLQFIASVPALALVPLQDEHTAYLLYSIFCIG